MSQLVRRRTSDDEKTIKYVWKLEDGNTIESIYLQLDPLDSLCISSQAGCNLQCAFCATGLGGLKRNLTPAEIVAQVEGVFQDVGLPQRSFEVSFMGMGEPLLNMEAMLTSVDHLQAKYDDLLFSLSTVGMVRQMYELAQRTREIYLQVSLHAPNDELRAKIMPIARRYPIRKVLQAAEHYARLAGKHMHINYLLLQDFNDSEACARQLADLVNAMSKEITVYVSLARFNAASEIDFARSPDERHRAFESVCAQAGLNVYQFASLGTDVGGGCGELRSQVM